LEEKIAPLIKLTLTKIMGLCTNLNLALVGSEQLLDSTWKCAYGLWHSHLLLLGPSPSRREVSAYIDSTHAQVINTTGFYKYYWDKGHLNMERRKINLSHRPRAGIYSVRRTPKLHATPCQQSRFSWPAFSISCQTSKKQQKVYA
jgi:hypothetical protein